MTIMMLCIYKTMVLPYFDYGDVVIAGASTGLLDKLQKLQEKCLKICLNITTKCDPDHLHNRAKVAKLTDRRAVHVNTLMFQMKQKVTLLNTDVVGWGWGGGVQTRARAAPCFIVDRPNVESFKRSVKYFGAVRWNR